VKEFYDIEVWQAGKEMVIRIYRVTKSFPKQETYGLMDQLRRAANSVCANIAEGYGRHHTRDKIKFYYNARGSSFECQSHILIAKGLGYVSPEEADEIVKGFTSINRMLNAMISALSNYHSIHNS